ESDASLLAQVAALGVEVRPACGLRDFEVARGQVEARTDAGTVRARVLVGADGAGSLVRKRLQGRRPSGRPLRLFRAELPAPAELRDTDAMVYDFTPMRPAAGLRGYLWVFPVPGGRINVGLMHDSARTLSGAALVALLRRELLRHGVELGEQAAGWPAWP